MKSEICGHISQVLLSYHLHLTLDLATCPKHGAMVIYPSPSLCPRARSDYPQPRGPNQIDDGLLSLRLKHGIHTIFIFADPTMPFSKVTEELLEVLRERYADGLTTSAVPPETTPVPTTEDEFQISYGVLKAPTDHSQGWKKLAIGENDTPSTKGLKNNAVVAFAFLAPGETPTANFEVEFPELEDED